MVLPENPVALPPNSPVTQKNIDALDRLLRITTPSKIKRALTNVFLLLLSQEEEISDLRFVIDEYQSLFRFLDELEDGD